jgi:hyperosmotically inducible protein
MKVKAIYVVALMVSIVVLSVTSMPPLAATMDDRIQASAENSYVFKTYLKGDDIKIHSEDGVVSLTGTVSEESHKSLAQETVTDLPGVKSVDNRLEVKGDHPAEESDARLSEKVKTTLLLHQNVGAVTKVSSKDGVVTLQGEATSQAQKDLTTEYARDVEGVKDVTNEMTVSNTGGNTTRTIVEKIDDASITAQVKLSLLFHRSTSVLSTSVRTKHGVVTLGGMARNAAEKDLVTKLVNDIKGVKKVENEMTIEVPK